MSPCCLVSYPAALLSVQHCLAFRANDRPYDLRMKPLLEAVLLTMQDGKKDGLGTYWWPTGASYKGEWSDGSMHGVGTFESPDGTRYQGGWARDLKQGLGKKWFPNGDTYEATSATDVCFGQLLLAPGGIGFAICKYGAHIVQLPQSWLPLVSKEGYNSVQSCANKLMIAGNIANAMYCRHSLLLQPPAHSFFCPTLNG